MRARYPDQEGDVVRDGVSVHYYVYGSGPRTILLMSMWTLVHAEAWKAQVPYLSRHFRVITIDARGNGKSDRPRGGEAYTDQQMVADVVAVLDAVGVEQVLVVGLSFGGHLAAMLSAWYPERVLGAVMLAPSAPFGPMAAGRDPKRVGMELENHEEWDKFNLQYWEHGGYEDFVPFFASQIVTEPHSTKQVEDLTRWGLETTGSHLADSIRGRAKSTNNGEEAYRSIRCPVLVIHGDDDHVIPHAKGALVAEITGGTLLTVEGGGHAPNGRDPVLVNRAVMDFAERLVPWGGARKNWRRALKRQKKALYLSSPIGLGHARRDLAIAQALKERRPGLHIDWLTQDPVTTFLAGSGETVHPASAHLAKESAHLESECGEHDLHVFQTLRTMDEILVSNFLVFQEVVESGHYDLIVADEAWDVNYFWHENPELKRGALAWFTDFVGNVPFEDGGEREAFLTADYNAEMIEQWERFPWLRDRALFVGSPEDVVPGTFGPGLPGIRDWTESQFQFTGYVSGYDPEQWGDRAALRAQLGYRPDEKVCIASVGGSGVGTPLLQRILDAWPTVQRRLPELRLVLVTGPRIEAGSLRVPNGKVGKSVDVRGYVPELNKHFTACDLALVQGGLTTCMELTAAQRPFLYFPLQHHFEQCFHVHHRLQRYRAGRRMDYAASDPDAIAAAMVEELARPLDYRPVETDGAARSAALLAEML